MKIGLIAPFAFAPKATTAARVWPLAEALAERGHAVTLWVPPYDQPSDSGQVSERAGVRIVHVRSGPHSFGNLMRVAAALWRAVRAAQVDVVHVFKPVGYAAMAGLALELGGPPLVVDTDDWEGTGGWNTINRYPWLWQKWFDFQEHRLITHARAVTVASRALQTQAWGWGVPPERVYYVPNGPTARFRAWVEPGPEAVRAARAQLGAQSVPFAIYTGFINLNDVLDMAVRALATPAAQAAGARLAIVGDGPGLPAVRAAAEAAGVAERVHFTGWVPHEAVPPLLAAADFAVFPYRDTLVNRAKCSIKILEYMAAGKAILTSRVGQNLEYLEHAQSGWLVEPGDEAAFAEGFARLLGDASLRVALGQAAQARVRARFDWRVWAGVVEQAYRAVTR